MSTKTKRRSKSQILFDVLETLEWTMLYFSSYLPTGGIEKKYALLAVELGYAESVGMAYQCDDDGWILENRQMREGWRPTDLGCQKLKEIRDQDTYAGYPPDGWEATQ